MSDSNDSYVNDRSASTNYGSSTTLYVDSSTSGANGNERTFANFNLSSIPSTATIVSASLNLYMYQAPGASRNYDAYRATGSWSESTITWHNQPAVASTATGATATGTTSNVWLTWNVTSDVQAFVNGTLTNYGWSVKDTVESSSTSYQASFYSKEYTVTTYDPQLVVTYR